MELREERIEIDGQNVLSLRGEGLIERSSAGDGAAVQSHEVGVFVITRDGALVEAGDYLLGPVQKALPGATSQQLEEPSRHPKWAAPRLPMADLLLFYDFNVWHRRCVLLKAMLVAGLGYQVMEGDEVIYDPRRDRAVPDHPAAQFVARPNENLMETLGELAFRFLVDFYATGNGYLEAARNRRGQVAALYHAPGRTMRRDARFRGYWQVKQARETFFSAFEDTARRAGRNEILHLYQYDPVADYYGMPDWYAALAAMGLDRTILEYNLRLFANSLMAHLAIVIEGGRLSTKGREAIKQFVTERMTGVHNAGRILLLEDENDRVKIRFEKLNMEIKDLLTTKPFEYFRDVVIGAHGVPPRLLGVMTPGQLGGGGEMENQLRSFKETVLRPAKRRVEQVFRLLLGEVHPGSWVRFAEMDVTDLRADGEFLDKMLERGVFKPEEVREFVEALLQ